MDRHTRSDKTGTELGRQAKSSLALSLNRLSYLQLGVSSRLALCMLGPVCLEAAYRLGIDVGMRE